MKMVSYRQLSSIAAGSNNCNLKTKSKDGFINKLLHILIFQPNFLVHEIIVQTFWALFTL